MNKRVKIIGCGVSGLTTGIVLLEAGYDVQIVTEKLPHQTTSAKAAAIWFPYEVLPQEKVNEWSFLAYEKFKTLSQQTNTGITMIELMVIIGKEADAWWKTALPSSAIKKATLEELPTPFSLGYKMIVPLIETPIYLTYLLETFKTLGGIVTIQSIQSLTALCPNNLAVINCTGLGSVTLCNDKSMYPIQGQLVKVAPQKGIDCIVCRNSFWGE